MGRYEGKTAVITGGSSGIGRSTVELLVREGAKVVFTGRNKGAIEATEKELGPNAIGIVSDTARSSDIESLRTTVQAKLGSIDFLFINAGVGRFAPFQDLPETAYDEMFAINVKGPFLTIQKLSSLLKDGGAIVLNTSVVNVRGLAATNAYAATKAALRSLARTLATEFLPRGIRVNAVSPGPISTPVFGKLGLPAEAVDGMVADMREANPMKRFGNPEEVARAALFLAFDATYTTGAELPVDGGLTQL